MRRHLGVIFCATILSSGLAISAAAQERSPSAPELPKVHVAEIIDCPAQTEIAPDAQALIDAGQSARHIPSLYPAGLSGGRGLCTLTVAPDGSPVKKYAEISQLGQIPFFVDFNEYGFDIYAGDRVGALTSNLPDIKCEGAVEKDRTVTCGIRADIAGNFKIIISTGERRELAVDVNPSKLFKRNIIKAASPHFESMKGSPLSIVPATPDCSASSWNDIAWDMILEAGPVKDTQLVPETTVFFTGPNPPPFWGSYAFEADVSQLIDFSVEGDVANNVVQALLGAEGARLKVNMACGDDPSAEFLTTRVRALTAIYNAMRTRF